MTLWLDAQLPPSICAWMARTFGVVAQSVRDLGLRDAEDQGIFDAARLAGAVVVTKDGDFVDLVRRLGSPPQIVWLRCGNTSNSRLRDVFLNEFAIARSRLDAGDPIVEVGVAS